MLLHLENNQFFYSVHFSFFFFTGKEPTTWSANNCLLIMVYSLLIMLLTGNLKHFGTSSTVAFHC